MREMDGKRRRIYGYCGLLTDESYTDDEWEEAGFMCGECTVAELTDGTIDG